MWPFKKKFPDPASQPEDAWAVAQAESDGQPLIIRFNVWAKAMIGHPSYPHRLGVAIPFLAEDGAPEKPSTDRLGEFEDELHAVLPVPGSAVHVLVITSARMRELVFYVADPAQAQQKMEALRARTTDLAVQFMLEHDPKWKVFASMVP